MSFSAGYVLPWAPLDDACIERVRAALEQALAQCVARWPGYAGSRLELFQRKPDRVEFVIEFPASLVQKPGWEADLPGPAADDGTYPCSFELQSSEAMPEHDLPAELRLRLRSSRSANRDAWITAGNVLDAAGKLLGGSYSDL